MDSRDIIVGELQDAVGATLGASAAAVMRRAGKAASARLWPELPQGLSAEEAGAVMAEGIAQLGSFGEFRITGVDGDGAVRIEFARCYFASLAGPDGERCGKQPICSFGFGLVEETLYRLTGRRTRVTLTRHDPATVTCFEEARPRGG